MLRGPALDCVWTKGAIMRRIILAAIFSGSLTGCGMPGDELVDPTEERTGEITGGQLVPANAGPPDTSVVSYWSDTLGGHLKSGQVWTGQNRPALGPGQVSSTS
jgi:hypothetical protein